jgi:hypothetical protein
MTFVDLGPASKERGAFLFARFQGTWAMLPGYKSAG